MTSVAAGKGVNISRAAVAAEIPTVAVLPAADDDPFVHELLSAGIDARPVPPAGDVRVNLAITEPDGTTTKLNSPGATVTTTVLDAMANAMLARAETASWVVLAGRATTTGEQRRGRGRGPGRCRPRALGSRVDPSAAGWWRLLRSCGC